MRNVKHISFKQVIWYSIKTQNEIQFANILSKFAGHYYKAIEMSWKFKLQFGSENNLLNILAKFLKMFQYYNPLKKMSNCDYGTIQWPMLPFIIQICC